MSWLVGSGLTRYGRHEGRGTLDLMSEAAALALADAGLERRRHRRRWSAATRRRCRTSCWRRSSPSISAFTRATPTPIQLGGATGFALVMLAHLLVEPGAAKRVLVVAGENRMTGQSRDSAIQALAQVGHPVYEVPLGPTIPAYYGLVASRYMHEFGTTEADLADLAVLMRRHAMQASGRAVPRPDHRRRRAGLAADRLAAEDPRLLPGLRRRLRLRHRRERRGAARRSHLRGCAAHTHSTSALPPA